jgi:hypothetical protein
LRVARAHADARAGNTARQNNNQVAADRGNLFPDSLLGAGSDSHHCDHRGNADDDAEHGERRAHSVDAQCPQGDSDACRDLPGVHCLCPAS